MRDDVAEVLVESLLETGQRLFELLDFGWAGQPFADLREALRGFDRPLTDGIVGGRSAGAGGWLFSGGSGRRLFGSGGGSFGLAVACSANHSVTNTASARNTMFPLDGSTMLRQKTTHDGVEFEGLLKVRGVTRALDHRDRCADQRGRRLQQRRWKGHVEVAGDDVHRHRKRP